MIGWNESFVTRRLMDEQKTIVKVGVGIVVSDDRTRVLTCLRRAGDYYGGYWEFPGGKCEPNESPADCIVRELQEELGITVRPVEELPLLQHYYADRDRHVELHPWLCELVAGAPRAIEVADFRWCIPAELLQLKFLPANGPLFSEISNRLR